eukprot:392253-Hanusia_phi.AAC.2
MEEGGERRAEGGEEQEEEGVGGRLVTAAVSTGIQLAPAFSHVSLESRAIQLVLALTSRRQEKRP